MQIQTEPFGFSFANLVVAQVQRFGFDERFDGAGDFENRDRAIRVVASNRQGFGLASVAFWGKRDFQRALFTWLVGGLGQGWGRAAARA